MAHKLLGNNCSLMKWPWGFCIWLPGGHLHQNVPKARGKHAQKGRDPTLSALSNLPSLFHSSSCSNVIQICFLSPWSWEFFLLPSQYTQYCFSGFISCVYFSICSCLSISTSLSPGLTALPRVSMPCLSAPCSWDDLSNTQTCYLSFLLNSQQLTASSLPPWSALYFLP